MENYVLGVHSRPEPAVDVDAADLERAHGERLCRQYVADLRRPDSKRDSAESPVGRRVRVAAGDRNPGLREPLLRTDHVDDPLFSAFWIEEGDPVLPAVFLKSDDHVLGERIAKGSLAGVRGDDVIDGGEGTLRIGNGEAEGAEHAERLRARDLVNQVERDEELGLAVRQEADGMRVPDLFKEAFPHLRSHPCESRPF